MLTETLGQLRRPPVDSAFRYFFQQVDVGTHLTLRRYPWLDEPSDPRRCNRSRPVDVRRQDTAGIDKAHAGGGSAYIAQATLYSAALGVAISQVFYATGYNHERAVPPASRRAGSGGRADPGGCPPHAATVFRKLQEQGADFLLTVKVNQKTLHRQIRSQFQGKRHIPFVATDHEIGYGRDITWTLRAKQAPEHIRETRSGTSWIVEVSATCTRDGKPFQATHLLLTSLRTTPEALLQLVRDRWSIEGWRWIRDTQLHEDPHCYRRNGPGAMATLRMAALNLLHLAGCQSIRAGMQEVMHDITTLLVMARTQPEPAPN